MILICNLETLEDTSDSGSFDGFGAGVGTVVALFCCMAEMEIQIITNFKVASFSYSLPIFFLILSLFKFFNFFNF